MKIRSGVKTLVTIAWCVFIGFLAVPVTAQLIDRTMSPNALNEGINKSFAQQVGAGRGDALTVDSSVFIIRRDPFRAIRRGRQLFQRKFGMAQGLGPRHADDGGDVDVTDDRVVRELLLRQLEDTERNRDAVAALLTVQHTTESHSWSSVRLNERLEPTVSDFTRLCETG